MQRFTFALKFNLIVIIIQQKCYTWTEGMMDKFPLSVNGPFYYSFSKNFINKNVHFCMISKKFYKAFSKTKTLLLKYHYIGT